MKLYIIFFVIFLLIISGKTLSPRDDILENSADRTIFGSVDTDNPKFGLNNNNINNNINDNIDNINNSYTDNVHNNDNIDSYSNNSFQNNLQPDNYLDNSELDTISFPNSNLGYAFLTEENIQDSDFVKRSTDKVINTKTKSNKISNSDKNRYIIIGIIIGSVIVIIFIAIYVFRKHITKVVI